MISISYDRLVFENPRIGPALELNAALFRREWRPHILAGGPSTVLSNLLKAGFPYISEENKMAAMGRLSSVTAAPIEAEFIERVSPDVSSRLRRELMSRDSPD